MNTLDIMRIFIPAVITFLFGIGLAPFLTHILYQKKMWKPQSGKTALDGTPAETFNKLHEKRDIGTPRFGGVLVWGSLLLAAAFLHILSLLYPAAFGAIAFISRGQTWVPLAALMAGAIVGFVDDLFEVQGKTGLKLRVRLVMVSVVALLCAWWFYAKLGVASITFPFITAPIFLGPWFILFFILVALFIYAGGVIDGIDGLAGGIFAAIFSAYAAIALFQSQFNIAGLCAAIVGGLLAFLWFNIPPARFYLSETGSMALTLALVNVAFLTDTVTGGKGISVLPIIALPLIVTVLSVLIQLFGKKVLGRKIFRIAPLHHHFEALGWPPYKVTMRYWVVSVMCAIIGIALALL